MSITKYTGANIKKILKKDLISHIMDLYQFIDLFDNSGVIKKLKEEKEEINKIFKETSSDLLFANTLWYKYCEENEELKKENAELKRCLNNEAGQVRMYDKKYTELKEVKQDWDNLMEFTSSLSGSPADPEDIKNYINGVNKLVVELQEEIKKLKEEIKNK